MKASRSNVSAAFNGDLKFLTDNFLRRFNKAYGGLFNDVWLLEGTGEMLASKSIDGTVTMNNEHRGAPVYDIDATCGADVRERMFAEDRVIGYIDLPEIRPNTQIVRANGDSMEPVVKDGNLVAVREVHSWDTVFYGQIYLVLMEEYRMLKYIRRYEPDEEHFVILRSENANYDDMRIAKEKIIKLFIVENILSVKVRI
ncbi:MAG: S24 family peptidase [Bacteroidaceae bacterium]|nr:S24 family peptidase [Bacteroidaceae bacterium]